jgi:Ni/Fe-hydrogenase 1 B-type cytochrome subunit
VGLTQLNVWFDVVFFSLYAVILVALSGHFIGNILSGRAKRRFGKEWAWPHHDSHPPTMPKVLHFQHVAGMIALAISGMYIRFPFFDGGRSFMRWVHYIAMIVVTINLFVRLWYAFASRQRDYKEFAITSRDITTAPKVILYYIFVKPSKPHLGKYNVMQKMTYCMFVPLLILQAFTGFALLTFTLPLIGLTPRDLLIGWWAAPLVGSVDYAGWIARTSHYVINWLFIILTTIHVYLSVTEDFPAFLDFFGLGMFDRSAPGHPHDDHGESHDDVAEPAGSYAAADHA